MTSRSRTCPTPLDQGEAFFFFPLCVFCALCEKISGTCRGMHGRRWCTRRTRCSVGVRRPPRFGSGRSATRQGGLWHWWWRWFENRSIELAECSMLGVYCSYVLYAVYWARSRLHVCTVVVYYTLQARCARHHRTPCLGGLSHALLGWSLKCTWTNTTVQQ